MARSRLKHRHVQFTLEAEVVVSNRVRLFNQQHDACGAANAPQDHGRAPEGTTVFDLCWQAVDVPTQVLVAVGPNKENRVPGLESHDISDVPAEVPPVVLWLPLIDRHDAVALGSAGTEQGATELERNQLGGPFVGAQQP